jgi:hypothetical protein
VVFCAEQPYTPNERKLSALDRDERTIWIADAHRDDGKRFVVCNYLRIHDSISGLDAAAWKRKRFTVLAPDKLTAFLELEHQV